MLRRVMGGLVLTAALAGTAAAQTVVGPMGGLGITKFSGADADISGDTLKTRTGFVIGGFATFPLGQYFAIEPQVFWVQKGANYAFGADGGGNGGTVERSIPDPGIGIKLGYLEIPVLLKAQYVSEGSTRIAPNIFVGPAIAFKTSCNLTAVNAGNEVSSECDVAGTLIKGTDFLIAFGAGIDIGPVALQGRYDLGLGTIDNSTVPDDVKNSGWLFTAGFRIPIGQ